MLKKLRLEKNKSQGQIAAVLGITQQAYGRYELEKSEIPKNILIALAQYYGISIDCLLGIEPPPSVNNGIIGSQQISGSTITISNGEKHTRELTEIEAELLRICGKLDIKKKVELLSFASDLENKE